MQNITAIIPFFNGNASINQLIASLPKDLPVIIVDDRSDAPPKLVEKRDNIRVVTIPYKGYFTGACNYGIGLCKTDILILNQDITFTDCKAWMKIIEDNRKLYGMIGAGIKGVHPAWPHGYISGHFMFARRDVINRIGTMDTENYPLWGSTCEWQLRACRAGYKVLPLQDIPNMQHREEKKQRFGDAINTALQREPEKKSKFIKTPPAISVIIPAYNAAKFLPDTMASLLGGKTSLGKFKPQTFGSFEIIIVDDASTDTTPQVAQAYADDWKAIYYIRRNKRGGTGAAENTGIQFAHAQCITILGADDMMQPDRLGKLFKLYEENGGKKVIYDDVQVFGHGKMEEVWPLQEFDFLALRHKNHMHAGILFSKAAWQAVGGYPEIMVYGREDWAFNVLLGRAGYCGLHVAYPGYLYRREEHNRTKKTTGKEWYEYFKNQIRSLAPDIYESEDKAMACCGGASRRPKTGGNGGDVAQLKNNPLPGAKSGMVLLEYLGGNFGKMSFFGASSGTRYEFGKTKPRAYVTKEDAPGFLKMVENGKPVFRQANTVTPAKMVEKPPLAPPSPPPQNAGKVHPVAPKAATPVPLAAPQKLAQVAAPKPLPTVEAAAVAVVQPVIEEKVIVTQSDDMTQINGVGVITGKKLIEAGYKTIKAVAKATPGELNEKAGLTFSKAQLIVNNAKQVKQ